MAASNRSTLNGDFHFNGTLTANNMTIPANSVTDASLTAPAPGGTFIDKDKLEHQINILFTQVHGVAASNERRIVHMANGPGVLERVEVTAMVANVGAATVTVAVRKNGVTSCLSGTLQLDSADAAYDYVSGTIDGAAEDYINGDVFDVEITAAAGGGTLGQGVGVMLVFREQPIG